MSDLGNSVDRDAGETIKRLRHKINAMRTVLQEVEHYLDDRADINREGTGPNQAMSLLYEVREVLND